MKNIDIIIKYLSGDMLPDERDKFKKKLLENDGLREEFESASSIWEAIRKQLKIQNITEAADREMLIAEILAEHDIQFYGTNIESKKENLFHQKLNKAMDAGQETGNTKKTVSSRIYYMVSVAAAAMITALLIILHPAPDLDELAEAYYQPVSDPVFAMISTTSRSEIGTAMALFMQGNYMAATSAVKEEMKNNSEWTELRLLLALACYETGDLTEAENHFLALIEEEDQEIADAANWYLSMFYIQTENIDKATPHLMYLESHDCQYQKRAGKLLKLMK